MCLDTFATPVGTSSDLVQSRKGSPFAWTLIHEDLNEVFHWRRDSVVGAETRLRAGQSGLWIALETFDFSRLQNVKTGCGTHLACCSLGIGVLSQGYSGRDFNLTTALQLVPRLGMSGAILMLTLSAYMRRTGTTILFTLWVTFMWLLNDAVGIKVYTTSSCRLLMNWKDLEYSGRA
jgi:hypothetical protein